MHVGAQLPPCTEPDRGIIPPGKKEFKSRKMNAACGIKNNDLFCTFPLEYSLCIREMNDILMYSCVLIVFLFAMGINYEGRCQEQFFSDRLCLYRK